MIRKRARSRNADVGSCVKVNENNASPRSTEWRAKPEKQEHETDIPAEAQVMDGHKSSARALSFQRIMAGVRVFIHILCFSRCINYHMIYCNPSCASARAPPDRPSDCVCMFVGTYRCGCRVGQQQNPRLELCTITTTARSFARLLQFVWRHRAQLAPTYDAHSSARITQCNIYARVRTVPAPCVCLFARRQICQLTTVRPQHSHSDSTIVVEWRVYTSHNINGWPQQTQRIPYKHT